MKSLSDYFKLEGGNLKLVDHDLLLSTQKIREILEMPPRNNELEYFQSFWDIMVEFCEAVGGSWTRWQGKKLLSLNLFASTFTLSPLKMLCSFKNTLDTWREYIQCCWRKTYTLDALESFDVVDTIHCNPIIPVKDFEGDL